MIKPFHSLLLLVAALASPSVWADIAETEPNNSCATAQPVAGSSFTADGTIDLGDVDYYRFTATPGAALQIDMKGAPSGVGTISDTVLGFFDSSCTQLASDDDSGVGTESLLLITVPSDGVVTIAAGGFPDFSFNGANSATGTYQLTVGEPTTAVISGKLLDAVTLAPLTSDNAAYVQLMSCSSPDAKLCASTTTAVFPDAEGQYSLPLLGFAPGTYQLWAQASNYAILYSKKFTIDENTESSKLNFKMSGLPLQISDVLPCTSAGSGGSCSYSYIVTNTTTAAVTASLWSTTYAQPNSSVEGFSSFMVGKSAARKPFVVTLEPGASTKVKQSLSLAGMASGAVATVQIFAASSDKLAQTTGHADGFTFTVGPNATLTVATGKNRAPMIARATKRAPMSVSKPSPVVIAGTAMDASTGQPLGDGSAYVSLQLCADPSYDLCTINLGNITPNSSGKFSFRATGLASGRYQLWAHRGEATSYAANFEFSGTSVTGQTIWAQILPISITNLIPCDNYSSLPAGSACNFTYDVTNTTGATQTVDLWTSVYASPTGSAYGIASYDIGKKDGAAPMTLTLDPGATVSVTQSIPLATQLKSGASASTELWVSVSGSPTNTLSHAYGFFFNIVP
ncbi:MAG: hypothetical protein JWQ90_3136 [Hydrocarboniphaga sp.]|uniref:hypothetical protein n=1 Tax=Hydrocarboniphaga sp. TaxID=2033016 RepID=UPI0026392E52|nr:hypothetical protein [Hydrocarboniphaga sp.]MDB5970686.1 hypothetical protein [Hydrocarboniphaga sp.]